VLKKLGDFDGKPYWISEGSRFLRRQKDRTGTCGFPMTSRQRNAFFSWFSKGFVRKEKMSIASSFSGMFVNKPKFYQNFPGLWDL